MISTDPLKLSQLVMLRNAGAVYVDTPDNLQITSWCSNAGVSVLNIVGRFLTLDGQVVEIADRHAPNTNRTIKTSVINMGDGWLLDLSITSDGAPLVGQVFVRAALVRGRSGALSGQSVLCQGFCNAVQALAFPGSGVVTSLERPGALRSITGTDPAAGVEISETVPVGARWRLITAEAILVTSAAVANRVVTWRYDDGANEYGLAGSNFAQAASATVRYCVGPFGGFGQVGGAQHQHAIPPQMIMLAGHRMKTSTASIDVGDNWSAPQMLVEEWLEASA